MMRGDHPRAALASVALFGALVLLTGCGSSTTTGTGGGQAPSAAVTVTPAQTSATVTSAPTSTPDATATSATATAGAGGGTAAPGAHSAPEPAFTEGESKEGLPGAEAVLKAHGYTASDPSQYHENQALRVLIGSRTGDQEQAFFFINGRYIGTDSTEPSGDIHLIEQSDTEVTLGYSLYKPGNPLCCPAGGVVKVRFQLDDGLLTTLDRIPPAESSTGPSRQ